ncbi:hypothetical protein LINPERPRIM_LOCUS29427 [Linum perenne]
MLESGDIQSGQGANQMTTLKRSGATRWSSHYSSVKSIISMFSATVEVIRNFQLGALNSRFNESAVRLLQLSAALDPYNSFQSFNADNIYKLAEEFYPTDFQYHEMIALEGELKFYDTHVVGSDEFHVSSLAKLLEKLVETRMERHYTMICRLIRLVLTLPVSTATTERAFSAMKYVKTDLRNKMADEFLADSLTIFIEREFAVNIDPDSIIEEFARLKDRRVQLTF